MHVCVTRQRSTSGLPLPLCPAKRARISAPRTSGKRHHVQCDARKYLFAAGGTGGHVFPAIAVADELRKLDPEAEILFMGDRERIEAACVPQAGYAWQAVRTSPVHRPLVSLQNVWNSLRVLHSIWCTFWRVRAYAPDVVLGTGGFVAFPTCVSASLLGCPFFLHEANAVPGLVNRLLCGFSRGVFTAFTVPAKYMSSKICKQIGNPLRQQFCEVERQAARAKLGLRPDELLLTVVGGSLGARAINEMMREILSPLLAELPTLTVHHQIGLTAAMAADAAREAALNNGPSPSEASVSPRTAAQPASGPAASASGRGSERYREFMFIDDMASQLAASDLVVSRSGAITCSELLATGTAAVLVPLSKAADNHQLYNAASLEGAGAAVIVKEDQDGAAAALKDKILELLRAPATLDAMRRDAKANGRFNAARDIALAMYQTALNPRFMPEVLKPFNHSWAEGEEGDSDEEEDEDELKKAKAKKKKKRKSKSKSKARDEGAENGGDVADAVPAGPSLSPA